MERRELALVTGGSRGIGRAVALRLAGMNMDIVFSYREGKAAADETAALIEKQGVRALAVQADAANREDCDRLVEEAYRFGEKRIDVLVNNAGITRDNLIMKMSEADFDAVIETNLKGCFNTIRHLTRQMLKQRSGKIINIASVSGVLGNAGQANYAASKAGIIGLTKTMARELASRGITVNAIAPGFIHTEMTEVLSDSVKEAAVAQIPLKRFGETKDIAEMAAFLASDKADYITGQVIHVDGGMAM